ncbi:MAG: SWIM zinc finger family protein, partial [Deltaproteobacteria bacterium]|nr:SWIM zinc finger family protein [Deltaproteobacteria bacterium]
MRTFTYPSLLTDGNLALALAPALTPTGIDPNPSFFRGFAAYPQALARGLLVLADVTSTRYFKYTPVAQRDPILSAQGDRLR